MTDYRQNIQNLREKIDKIDAMIIKKLAARQNLSHQIGQLKASLQKPIVDLEREVQQKIRYAQLSAACHLDEHLIQQIFKIIITHSREIQKNDQ